MTLAELNRCDREQFIQTVGVVFESAPWVAERAWRRRPFTSFDDLSTRLIQEVQAAPPDEQLALLQSTPASADASLRDLTEKYRKKFGFPFIFAVKDNNTSAIFEALGRRMKSTPEQEFQIALGHAFRLARFRLEAIVDG